MRGDLSHFMGQKGLADPHGVLGIIWGCWVAAGTTTLLLPPLSPSPQHPPETRNLPGGKEQFVFKGRGSGRAASSRKSGKGLQPRQGRAAGAVPMLGCSGAEGRLRRGQELINAKHFWTAAQALFAVFISATSNRALRCPLGPGLAHGVGTSPVGCAHSSGAAPRCQKRRLPGHAMPDSPTPPVLETRERLPSPLLSPSPAWLPLNLAFFHLRLCEAGPAAKALAALRRTPAPRCVGERVGAVGVQRVGKPNLDIYVFFWGGCVCACSCSVRARAPRIVGRGARAWGAPPLGFGLCRGQAPAEGALPLCRPVGTQSCAPMGGGQALGDTGVSPAWAGGSGLQAGPPWFVATRLRPEQTHHMGTQR